MWRGRLAGSSDVGCDHIKGSSGSPYRWALQNPQLVAPVLLDYDVLEPLGLKKCCVGPPA